VDPEIRNRPGLEPSFCAYSEGPPLTVDSPFQLMVMSGNRSQSVCPAVAQTQLVALVKVHWAVVVVVRTISTTVAAIEERFDFMRGRCFSPKGV